MHEEIFSYWANASLVLGGEYERRKLQIWRLPNADEESHLGFLRCELRMDGRLEGVLNVTKRSGRLVVFGYMARDLDHPVFIHEAPFAGLDERDLMRFAQRAIDYDYEYPGEWKVESQIHDLRSVIDKFKK